MTLILVKYTQPILILIFLSQGLFRCACVCRLFKAKFHYAILVSDRSEAGRRPAVSWNLAYHLGR